MRAGDRVALACADLDDDGAGVGEVAGAALHVSGALPAEQVEAIVSHVSPHAQIRQEGWARLERIIAPSDDRRAPVCPGFGRCGGCAIQHLAYERQLEWKRARIVRAFAAHAALRDLAVAAAVASPRLLGYRNNAKLVAARPGPGRPTVLGAYAPRTHDVVDLLGCRMVEPAIDAVATELRGLLDQLAVEVYDEAKLTGRLRYVVLRSNQAGQVLCTLIVARPLPNGRELADRLRGARPEVVGVVEHENRTRGNAIFAGADPGPDRTLAGEATLVDVLSVGGQTIQLRLTPGAFFQSNREVAGLAYGALAKALALGAGERVVDAYSGVGGIGLALARGGAEVIGIEAHAGAVQNAAEAAARNGLPTARFVAGDAGTGLATLDRADAIVVNPPRRGCAPDVLDQIARLAPRAVGYLSCDPDTLARDLAVLATRGYRPAAVTPYDMLPHTPHVEALAILTRD
jgi:23S rRNA (uracil1939-C5)-methyltransferase